MVIRKPAALLHCSSLIHTPHNAHGAALQHPTSSSPSSCPPHTTLTKRQTRRYASIRFDQNEVTGRNQHSHDHPPSHVHPDDWPQPQHPHKVPTPYQILCLRRGETYTKARFTDLVKVYHPDHCNHASCRHLAEEVRLERYRLIITAHAIMSDPAKRQAYDTFGAGWGAHENIDFRSHRSAWGGGGEGGGNHHPNGAPTHGPDSAMGNATWEDWERWYRKHDPPPHGDTRPDPQSPVYLSNTAFVSVIVMLAALGGIGQATRADTASKAFLTQRNEAHTKAAEELQKVRSTSAGWSREERIKMFLRSRDPAAYGDENVQRLVLNPDICDGGADPVGSPRYKEDLRRKYADSGVRQTPDLYSRDPP